MTTSEQRQLECRIVITHRGHTFDLGMYDPVSMRYEALGSHSVKDISRIVGDLRVRMERERHIVSFSELTGPR